MANVKTKSTKRLVITDHKEAVALLSEVLRERGQPLPNSRSTAKWVTVDTVAQYVKSKRRVVLDRGWFGRSLCAAMRHSKKTRRIQHGGKIWYSHSA